MGVKINLDLPFKKLAGDTPNNKALALAVITSCVNLKYKDKTIPRTESRLWASLQDKLELNETELDKAEFDFLRDVVENTDLPPHFSSWLWTVRDYLNNLSANGVSRC